MEDAMKNLNIVCAVISLPFCFGMFGMLPQPDQVVMDMAEISRGVGNLIYVDVPTNIWTLSQLSTQIQQLDNDLLHEAVDAQQAYQTLQGIIQDLSGVYQSSWNSVAIQRRCTSLIRKAQLVIGMQLPVQGLGGGPRRNLFPSN